MPELPEVETIKRDLSRLVIGKKILDITTDSPKQVKPSLAEVKKGVVGSTIKALKRRGKLLQIMLSNGKILTVHLKMTGRLLVRKKDTPKDNWQHVVLKLSGEKELRFADSRKFGWLRLIENSEKLEELLVDLGSEPLDGFSIEELRTILASTSRAIKIVLMDQKKIAGIGNIYACEALFLAKIDPRRSANKINRKEVKGIYQAIRKVLRAGIKYRGASDQYYLDALGHKGSYQDHFLVYGREGQSCRKCKKAKIKKIKLGGRGTNYCPACQH